MAHDAAFPLQLLPQLSVEITHQLGPMNRQHLGGHCRRIGVVAAGQLFPDRNRCIAPIQVHQGTGLIVLQPGADQACIFGAAEHLQGTRRLACFPQPNRLLQHRHGEAVEAGLGSQLVVLQRFT